jgi:pyruvate dehydrogenase E1 component alpha subunit
MNLAASQRLPVLFVCENNLFSSHLDIALRQPSDRIARYADAHKVRAATVDGNDLIAVTRAAAALVADARNGAGPGFLEAITYRHRGHVGPNEDVDVGVRRKMSDLAAWKRLDPIHRFRDALLAVGLMTAAQLDEQERELRVVVQGACERANAAPYPEAAALLGAVFAGKRA